MTRSLRVAIFCITGSTVLHAGVDTVLEPGVLNPSARCGQCHQQIYETWERSLHAQSAMDPIFQASYMQAYLETAGKAREICLRCHAPAAVLSGDLEMRQPLSREGIPCDFCHSVVSVDLKRRDQPFRLMLDGVKRGPLPDAVSPAHKVAKSELHKSAEFCAGCHEYVNPAGVPILSTYSEWKASWQAKIGKTCQDCHMPSSPGQTVRPELGVYRSEINLHDVSGGHSSDQVRKAATVKIVKLEREEPTLAAVEVEVANVGSGHFVPTGMPTRRLVLEVTLYFGAHESRHLERRYERVLVDSQGQRIVHDHRAILQATTIREDSRLRPGERRLERFTVAVPEKGDLRAEAQLRYVYEPELLLRHPMTIDMGSDQSP